MSRRRAAVALALLGMSLLAPQPDAPRAAGPPEAALWAAAGVLRPATPAPAPSFTLPDLSGRRVALSGFQGRLVMVYFWGTW